MTLNEVLALFRAWQLKLALARVHRSTEIKSAQVPLFRFPEGESIHYWTETSGQLDFLQEPEDVKHGEWSRKKLTLLGQATERTLFLVDREAKKENLGDQYGDAVVMEIAAQRDLKAGCIMFTHTVASDECEALRRKIVSTSNGALKGHPFSVMSKRSLGRLAQSVRSEFSRAGCALFTVSGRSKPAS